MKVEHLNPFLNAVTYVLGEYGFPPPTRGRLGLGHRIPCPLKGIAVLVGLTGEAKGRVFYDFEHSLALALASSMMGEPCAVLDDMARSAISELCNQFTGWASTNLKDTGHTVDMTPPTLLSGDNMELTDPDVLKPIEVLLSLPQGGLTVNLAVVSS